MQIKRLHKFVLLASLPVLAALIWIASSIVQGRSPWNLGEPGCTKTNPQGHITGLVEPACEDILLDLECQEVSYAAETITKGRYKGEQFNYWAECTDLSEGVQFYHYQLGDPWLDPLWASRKKIPLIGADSAGTNYQLKIEVGHSSGGDVTCDGTCQADFDDIRFTDNDGATELDHWREKYTGSDEATFWIEVQDDLSGGNNPYIYIYYGNGGASTTSDGDATFLFFDDFNDGVWTDKWENSHPQGTYTETGGLMKLYSTGYSSLDSITHFTGPSVIESRSRRFTGGDYHTYLREVGKNNLVRSGICNYGRYFCLRRMGVDFGSEQALFLDASSNDWKEFRGLLHGTTWHVYRGTVLDTWERDDSLPLEASADGRQYYVQIFTHEARDTGAYWDWIRVRKYSDPEPSVGP